jgi:hypothetical protein
MDQKITDMYELLDSIEVIIEAADPAKRKALAQTIDAFAENFPEDFFLGCRPAGADAPAPFAVNDRRGVPPRGAIEAARCHPAGGSQVGRQRLAAPCVPLPRHFIHEAKKKTQPAASCCEP